MSFRFWFSAKNFGHCEMLKDSYWVKIFQTVYVICIHVAPLQ